MPRRALLLLTALVLALHWLALGGLPLHWSPFGAHGPDGAVFSTRSIAPPPPPAPPAAPAPRPPAPKPRPKPPKPPKPAPAPIAEEAPASPMPAEPLAEPGTETLAEPAAVAEAAPGEEETPAAPAQPPASETAPAASEPAAPAPAAPTSAPEDPGVDIVPPGGSADRPASTAPPPVRIPPPTRLAFDVSGQVKRFHYSARAELVWKHDGSRYEARQEVSAFLIGSRSQTSVGQLTGRGLLPARFGDKARSEQAAQFDFAQGRVTFSANTPPAAVAPGAQDRLSVFIQLAALLAADPSRYPDGTEITLTTVSARAADRWTFRVEGTETLDLPAGATPALKLQRLPRHDADQKAELWLAPSLQYLPVRIRLSQANGDFADLRLNGSGPP